MESARILIEVQAGMIPGKSEHEFNKQWAITSNEWDEGRGFQVFLDKLALANSYALKLQINSVRGLAPNWVRVDYIWL